MGGIGNRYATRREARFPVWANATEGLILMGMDSTEKKPGQYLGTEVDEKWWRRYWKHGLLARGAGEFWLDDNAFCFRRHLTKTPIMIPYGDMLEVKLGKWHSGRFGAGGPVVKILWKTAQSHLSSGFIFSRNEKETQVLVEEIRSRILRSMKAEEARCQAFGTITNEKRG